jgi:excinuclease ABC subunit A
MYDAIRIKGARENNLKNITVEIPKNKLVVLTGPSGSGKSTLAMDTLQRECQRQYMESMGMVADAVGKPKVEAIVGLSPSISVGQHVTNRNPRSTVGTVTDIYTYLRVIFARAGERPCPTCGKIVPPPRAATTTYGGDDEGQPAELVDCPHCGAKLEKLTSSHFSFNVPEGACETCSGVGEVASLNMAAIFDRSKSFRAGGVTMFNTEMWINYQTNVLGAAARHYGFSFDPDLPLGEYSDVQRDLLYYGVESEEFSRHFPGVKPPKSVQAGRFEGVITGIWRRYKEYGAGGEGSMTSAEFFQQATCPTCHGAKLKQSSLAVRVGGAGISEIAEWPLEGVLAWAECVRSELSAESLEMLDTILTIEMPTRLRRILDVGLGYLSLGRQSVTLSGGEAQRLRLASLLGSGLTGVLYILDEPTAGLHARDTTGLIQVLKQLRDLGNTVLVIEHDVEMMRAADHVIDMGPGAGAMGGRVVGEGSLADLMAAPESVTGAFLREEQSYKPKTARRKGTGQFLTVRGARARNLKNVTVSFPLGCLVSVTGVSGSGKSTLLFDLLAEGAKGNLRPEGCDGLEGIEHVGNWITVDQSPIGRMQRSNVATYTEVYTALRNLYAGLPEAKKRKLTAKHFSFNTPGGRCEHCQGLGVVTVGMMFMADIEVRCPACKGRRFQEEVLRVTCQGRTISDVLDMTVQESLPVFAGNEKMADMIRLLCEVGLGYLHWGQSVRTLSGGEGQRLRLAAELANRSKKHTLYLLDEPTTGLHPVDVQQLIVLLNKLVDAGNTVIVVEHNLELIRESDWIIDIGPEGGEKGGQVIAQGTPLAVAEVRESYTGQFLREALG